MIWVWVFGGIAVATLVALVFYAIWLWHKASDLFSEVAQLAQRGEEAAALLSQLSSIEQARLRRLATAVDSLDG